MLGYTAKFILVKIDGSVEKISNQIHITAKDEIDFLLKTNDYLLQLFKRHNEIENVAEVVLSDFQLMNKTQIMESKGLKYAGIQSGELREENEDQGQSSEELSES